MHQPVDRVPQRAVTARAPAEPDLAGQILGRHPGRRGVPPHQHAVTQQEHRAGTHDRRPALLEVRVVEREPGLPHLRPRVGSRVEVDDLGCGCHDQLGRWVRPVLAPTPVALVLRDMRPGTGRELSKNPFPRDANGNASGNGPRSHALVNTRPASSLSHPARVPCQESVNRTTPGTAEVSVAGMPPRNLPVLIQHEEELMNRTLTQLDREWRELCRSSDSRDALDRWRRDEPALAGSSTLDAILVERREDAEAAPAILAALARLAVKDELAARTLLQALLPGLVKMASTCCSDDPAALDELLSLAWERIRTYPTSRPGPVAANVIMDVRKRYREHRAIEAPQDTWREMPTAGVEPSAEDVVLGRCAIEELIAAQRDGVIDGVALGLILRTRVDGISLEVAATEQRSTVRQANCIRWRAERRLRPVLAMVS